MTLDFPADMGTTVPHGLLIGTHNLSIVWVLDVNLHRGRRKRDGSKELVFQLFITLKIEHAQTLKCA